MRGEEERKIQGRMGGWVGEKEEGGDEDGERESNIVTFSSVIYCCSKYCKFPGGNKGLCKR